MPRYNSLINPKMLHKVERELAFREFPAYGFEELFEAIGIEGLVDVWEGSYCLEFVYAFITHLSHDKKTGLFSTEVQGVKIDFTAGNLCAEYHLPTAGIDVYDSHSEGALTTDEALKFVLGPDFQGLRRKKLVRSMLRRDEHKLLTYILHNNVMPRGGKANDEVPHTILQFICAAYLNKPINFVTILKEGFEKLAKKNVKFVAYHKLITSLCLRRGVGLGVWERVQGEILDKKKLRAMHLPESPGGDETDDDEDDEDDDDEDDDGDEGRQTGGAETEGGETEGAQTEGESEGETLAAHTQSIRDRAEERHQAIMGRLGQMEAAHQGLRDDIQGLRATHRAELQGLRDEIRLLRGSRRPRGSRPTSSDPGPS